MRTRRWVRFALVPVLAATGLAGTPASPAAAAPPDLHVTKSSCVGPPGNGSPEAPFCTIGAALAVAEPGQTVRVYPGSYTENVWPTRSGTSTAPITVRAVNDGQGLTVLRGITGGTGTTPLVLHDVHDIVIDGLTILPAQASDTSTVVVDNAARVTLNGVAISVSGAAPGIQVTGASSDVTISRGYLTGGGTGLRVEGGSQRTVVTSTTVRSGTIRVGAAADTVVTGNTISVPCRTGVAVEAAADGVDLRNNVVRTMSGTPTGPLACPTPASAPGIAVAAEAADQTRVDHNLIDTQGGNPLYRWGATDYATIEPFRAATGQGAHDIAAPVRFEREAGGFRGYLPLAVGSPAVDSADATAPGVQPTDALDNGHADDPAVANTGTGTGFHDRGAVERTGPVTVVNEMRRVAGGHPFDTEHRLTLTPTWTTDGPVGKISARFRGETAFAVSRSRQATHRFRQAGLACSEQYVSYDDFRTTGGLGAACTVLGARFNPVAPTRVLDTRSAIGTGGTHPIAGDAEVVLGLPSIAGVAAADITAVVLNVTVTRPTAAGHLRVYPSGAPLPEVSNVNFVAGETVPNLVTVPMTTGAVRIRHTGPGTVHIVADLQGYYAASGHAYRPIATARALDTRTGGGPIAGGGSRLLDLSGRVPANATAAVVNLTATRPTAAGHLSVYADGAAVPTASNLNFTAGQTIPNLVIVPVTNGKARIHNESAGTTHVVADLNGWFGSSGTDAFVPYGPFRLYDSRAGAPLPPFGYVGGFWAVHWPLNDASPRLRSTAQVVNLTVTRPTAAGHLSTSTLEGPPAEGSNVNFVTGETATNHAIVPTTTGGYYYVINNSAGSSHVVVDHSGYFATF